MTPQQLAVAGTVIAFIAGIFASRGLISKETAEYLASPEAMATLSGIVAAGAAIWQLVQNRPGKRAADTIKRDPEGTAAKLAETNPQTVVAAAATVPGVETIVAAPKMAAAIPSEKVISRDF